tara:strand:- start:416 stop:706 length:291 start_codon:yes stop_codon:yes gene_type:complete
VREDQLGAHSTVALQQLVVLLERTFPIRHTKERRAEYGVTFGVNFANREERLLHQFDTRGVQRDHSKTQCGEVAHRRRVLGDQLISGKLCELRDEG